MDWMADNRQLLSMQRLRNLSRRFPVDPGLVGAVMIWAEGQTLSAVHKLARLETTGLTCGRTPRRSRRQP
jgi:hypothetical protein